MCELARPIIATCQKTCTLNSQQYTFDLSGFANSSTTGYLHAQDSQEHDYYWDACDVISAVLKVDKEALAMEETALRSARQALAATAEDPMQMAQLQQTDED